MRKPFCEGGARMYVLGISGSPRKDGNTSLIVKKALEGAGCESKYLSVAELKINPCDGCQKCKELGMCRIRDDMQQIYDEIQKADVIILGSPNYFGNVSSHLKNVMDRTLPFYFQGTLKLKVGGAVGVSKWDGGEMVLQAMNRFFQYHNMLYAGGVIAKGGSEREVLHDMTGVRESVALGTKAKELAERIKK